MTTVGEILKNRRIEKGIEIYEIERVIKVRSKFIEAIEKNDFSALPPQTFTRGFIKNYASYLGLVPEEILAFYRRQVNEEKAKIIPEKSVINKKFILTPPILTALGVGLFLVILFLYLLRQYLLYAGSPVLLVSEPADYTVVKENSINVVGKTDRDNFITINGEPVAVNENGSFSVKVDLSAGLNNLQVVSLNKFKKESKILRHVRYEP